MSVLVTIGASLISGSMSPISVINLKRKKNKRERKKEIEREVRERERERERERRERDRKGERGGEGYRECIVSIITIALINTIISIIIMCN